MNVYDRLIDYYQKVSVDLEDFTNFIKVETKGNFYLKVYIETLTSYLDLNYSTVTFSQRCWHLFYSENLQVCPFCKSVKNINLFRNGKFKGYLSTCGYSSCFRKVQEL